MKVEECYTRGDIKWQIRLEKDITAQNAAVNLS
jgi:hypothetical protein